MTITCIKRKLQKKKLCWTPYVQCHVFFLQNSLVLRLQATKRRVFHSFPPAIRELAVLPQ